MLDQAMGKGEEAVRLNELRILLDGLIDHLHILAAAIDRSVSNKAVLKQKAMERS